VAAFAIAGNNRLIIVQSAIALLVAAACGWFVMSQWYPVVEESIRSVPAATSIVRGELVMPRAEPVRIGANNALEILIDPKETRALGGTADIVASLTATRLKMCGVLGCVELPYSKRHVITLSRDEMEPWWGAWQKPILALIVAGVFIHLMVAWWIVGLAAAPIVKLIGFYADRKVSFGGSWRVANASLLPGAVLVAGGILLHGVRALDVAQLALVYAVQVVCGIIFLLTSPSFLPHLPGKPRGNPFETGEKDAKPAKANPFDK
jgi:hypothetical protein